MKKTKSRLIILIIIILIVSIYFTFYYEIQQQVHPPNSIPGIEPDKIVPMSSQPIAFQISNFNLEIDEDKNLISPTETKFQALTMLNNSELYLDTSNCNIIKDIENPIYTNLTIGKVIDYKIYFEMKNITEERIICPLKFTFIDKEKNNLTFYRTLSFSVKVN